MVTAYIGLGSNLGDRSAFLSQALARLAAWPGVHDLRPSRWVQTRPIGGPAGQPAYLNGVAAVRTSLEAPMLWRALQAVEAALGRTRPAALHAPRTLDLDLLLYGDLILEEPGLVVPHPRLAVRRFVLEPLAALAPEAVHPCLHQTAEELLANLDRRPPTVALAGPRGPAAALAAVISQRTGARVMGRPWHEGRALEARLEDRDRWLVLVSWPEGATPGPQRPLDSRPLEAYHALFMDQADPPLRPTFVVRLDGGPPVRAIWMTGVPTLEPAARDIPGIADEVCLAMEAVRG